MQPKLATKRYFFTVIGSSLGYLGSVFGITFIHDKVPDGSIAGILISLLPAVFICLMLRAVWQFLKDTDEVARHELTQSMMAGLFVLLALSGGWGLVELFNDSMPRLPVFFAFPVFFLSFGGVSAIRYRRCV
ncbi:MAG: hypothetical protein ABJN69_10675 [Hellea sp.]